MLATLGDRDAFKEKVQADKERFILHDGSLCTYGDLFFEADEYMEVFKGYVK